MKAQVPHAPVRAAVSRPVCGLSTHVEAVGPSAAVPWDPWLERLSNSQGKVELRSPAGAGSAELANTSSLQALLECEAPLPVKPPLPGNFADVHGAVATALQAPDVCFWSRGHGQDVSHLTAEVLRHATRQGLRTLYVAASPAPLERALAKLASDPTFLAIRFAAPGERCSNGPLTRFCLDEQRLALRPKLLARAEQCGAEADLRRARIAAEAEIWQSLGEIVRDMGTLSDRSQELADRTGQLPEEVRHEAEALAGDDMLLATGPFAVNFAIVVKGHRERLKDIDATLFPLGDQREALQRLLADLANEKAAIEVALAGFLAGLWWTPSYWSARLDSERRARALRLAAEEVETHAKLAAVDAAVAEASRQRQTILDARDADLKLAVSVETERRRSEIQQQRDLLEEQLRILAADWKRLSEKLPLTERPLGPSLEAQAAALAAWQKRVDGAQPSTVANVQEIVADFLSHMPSLAPVLAGTMLALVRHADFAAATQAPFDLVILEDADRLSEADFYAILGKASRALVIGSAPSSASTFGKIWRRLHRSETPSRYQWSRPGGYLCSLRSLSAADERYLESERLADFPEIELRIHAAPHHVPGLAQVVFPASMSAGDAKLFIYRELQEASVDRVDRPKQIRDDAERFVIAWECPETPTNDTIELEPGLRETFCVDDAHCATCRLEFDKAAGWNLPKIHAWLRSHLSAFDARRTVDVQV